MLNICRGCLTEAPDSGLSSEAPLSSIPLELTHLFVSITGQTISNTHASLWLCWKCRNFLQKCIEFKSICIQSASILEDYLRKIKIDVQLANCILESGKRKIAETKLNFSEIKIAQYPESNTDTTNTDATNTDTTNTNTTNTDTTNTGAQNEVPQTDLTVNDTKLINMKQELKDDFQLQCKNTLNDILLASEITDVKTEFKYDSFSGCDEEHVIHIRKKKKIKLKKSSTKPKEQIHESRKQTRITNKSTPSKNFDLSMVIVTSLTREQQVEELENLKKCEEYVRAPYKCEMCAKGFAHEIVYKEHIGKHEPVSGQYMCHLCTQCFNTKRNLCNHLDTHANRYTCRLCNKVVISKQNIILHMYTEHDETNKEIKCNLCQKIYKNRYTYAKHMRIHNSTREYKCHLCHKVFLWKDNLNRHLTRHKNEKPFMCNLCPKSFFLKENLKDHQLVHTGEKKFYCVECDLSYATQVKLNQHLKRGTRHLRPEQLTFACKLCDKRYTNNFQLSIHMDRIHLNKRSQACQQCDAAFVSKKTLQTHVKSVHEGYRKPRNHICETCGKRFSDKQVLKAHLRTHTGEKPYSCKHCGAKFAHSGAMYTHVKLVHLKLKRNNHKRHQSSKISDGDKFEKETVIEPSASNVMSNISTTIALQ
ncbi:uncharacterized protein LOC143919443 isoform X2 [Arctopsyche grandis]|uniref:uncharacterized protein LOC143919443 isoform X2 n=1 Tax=Arctopsyche grandis TaxID=121162 RepID=UPI00406D9E5A